MRRFLQLLRVATELEEISATTAMTKRKQRVNEVSGQPVGALKVNAACKYLGGVSRITMRRLIERGHIKPCRNLRHLLIPISELDKWLSDGQDIGAKSVRRKGAGR
jgi:excisionase family DNA binding protein